MDIERKMATPKQGHEQDKIQPDKLICGSENWNAIPDDRTY